MRDTVVRALALLTFSLAGWGPVQAAPLVLTPDDADATTTINSNLGSWSDVCAAFGLACTPEAFLLYKANAGSPVTESGSYASSYETTFNPTDDPEDATIWFITGFPAIVCPSCYLVVKDGNHEPAQYLFDISLWNGTDTIELQGFWPKKGAISNVAIWGARAVPEPSSLLLVGIGAFGLAFGLRRRPRG